MPKGLGRGYFFQGEHLTPEPAHPRAVAFTDGQNLFHAVREAFGYSNPNFDARALVTGICHARVWRVTGVRFYTGIPDSRINPQWHRFWSRKLGVMGRERVHVFARPLRYRPRTIRLRDGSTRSILLGEEKGIDVRLALDALRMAHRREYDVALILSQDQDLSEVPRRFARSPASRPAGSRLPPLSRPARAPPIAAASTRLTGSGSTAQSMTPASTGATTDGGIRHPRKGAVSDPS